MGAGRAHLVGDEEIVEGREFIERVRQQNLVI
jgi:hypothetical protein